MGGKPPSWESALWSYVSSGDGMHCPVYDNCRARRLGSHCADDNRDKLSRLIDSDSPSDADGCDYIEPGSGVIFPFVEKLAQRQLEKGGICCPPVPTKLISLADEYHPIEVHRLPLKACHAAVWHLRGKWVIQLEDGGTLTKDRFNLFHEAFHILAHCNCQATPVFSKRGIRQGSFNELLADYFAICILMPREWVKERWLEAQNLNRMAGIFDVSVSIMWFRLRQLALI